MLKERTNKSDKGYNIKLPRNFRDRFSRPYDKFLSAILRYADMLTPAIIVTAGNQMQAGPKDWLVWLNDDDRRDFMRMKQDKMPSATNPQFISALLMIHEDQNPEGDTKHNDARPKLWPQVEKNGLLQPQIVTYRHTSKVAKKKAPLRQSYKINGVELLETET
jgi:hypothetical protein